MSAASEFSGSPAYAAPEQFEGGVLGPETDLYALGVLLFELAAGELPHSGETAPEILAAKRRPRAPRLHGRAGVSSAFATLLERLLERDRRDRPDSAAQVAELLGGSSTVTVGGLRTARSSLCRAGVGAVRTGPPSGEELEPCRRRCARRRRRTARARHGPQRRRRRAVSPHRCCHRRRG